LTAYNATVKTYNDALAGDKPEDAKREDVGDKPSLPWTAPAYGGFKYHETTLIAPVTALDAANNLFINADGVNQAYFTSI
jgi:hypothetical protein